MAKYSKEKRRNSGNSEALGAGIAIGVALGVAFDNIGLGLAFGVLFGAILKQQRQKQKD